MAGARVERLHEADVMVRMDGRGLPAGHVVAHTVVGLELLQLLRFEDLQRQPTGRPMNAQSGYFAAPVLGLLTAVVQVAELPTLKEALTHVLDAALDVGFILRPAHPGGVDQEATLLAALQGSRVSVVVPMHLGRRWRRRSYRG